jgi:xanthine/uracil permease
MKPEYIYAIDDRLPLRYALIYGLQWTVIMFPGLIIVARLSGLALHVGLEEEVRFFQLMLLTSGLFTGIQSLWGHRFPLLDGPSTALLLTLIVLAPYGLASIQGGLIAGSAVLILLVVFGKLAKIVVYATPNVVGVILMLIAFSLLPHLTRIMAGVDGQHPEGNMAVFSFCLALVVMMAGFSHWFKGFWKTIALLLGMVLGTAFLFLFGSADYRDLQAARWVSLPSEIVPSWPQVYWPAVVAFACTYLAVAVNSLGSLHGIANLTDEKRLPQSINRGIFINGVAGICCGFMGVVGMVSYSMSPGVILATRVSSRYATASCGVILIIAAFVPKLAALLSLIPAPVVGAALFVAMGVQVGAGLGIVATGEMTGRDYFVVGLPVLLGTCVGFLPENMLTSLPVGVRVVFGNGLVIGILLVVLLEHVVLRKVRSQRL